MDSCLCYLPRNRFVGEEKHYHQYPQVARYLYLKLELVLLFNVTLAILLGSAIWDSGVVLRRWDPVTCTVLDETEYDDHVQVSVIYHMSDNKPLNAEFELCDFRNQEQLDDCAQKYTHGSRFECLVHPRHRSRVIPKETAEHDLQESKELFIILESISIAIPEILYLLSIFIFIVIKKMMRQPLPESRFGFLGSYVIVALTTCLGPKEYIKISKKEEPLLAINASPEDNSFIKDISNVYRRVLAFEMKEDGEEILWTFTPTRKELLKQPGLTRLFESIVGIYCILSIPTFFVFGVIFDLHKGWYFAIGWLQVLLLLKIVFNLYVGFQQVYILLSTRFLVMSRGLFDFHVNCFPLDSRINFTQYDDGSGSLVYDVTKSSLIVAEYVPNVQELHNIIIAQLDRTHGGEENNIFTDEEDENSFVDQDATLLTDDFIL